MFSKIERMIRERLNVQILVKKFQFYWKRSERIGKVRVIERNSSKDRQICSSYRDFRIFEYFSYRDFLCLKRVSRFKGPTNLIDLTRCLNFRLFELSRVNFTWGSSSLYFCFSFILPLDVVYNLFYIMFHILTSYPCPFSSFGSLICLL